MIKKIGFVHTGVAIADMFKPVLKSPPLAMDALVEKVKA